MTKTKAVRVSLLPDAVRREAFAEAWRFGGEFYECLTARSDELFELVDAILCADGAVKTPVDLTLLPEHRRGHGAMYGGLNHGRIDVGRLRTVLAGLPLPRFDGGRLVLAVDVLPWLHSDAPCSAERLFCHVYGPRENSLAVHSGVALLLRGGAGAGRHPLDCDPRVADRGRDIAVGLRETGRTGRVGVGAPRGTGELGEGSGEAQELAGVSTDGKSCAAGGQVAVLSQRS